MHRLGRAPASRSRGTRDGASRRGWCGAGGVEAPPLHRCAPHLRLPRKSPPHLLSGATPGPRAF